MGWQDFLMKHGLGSPGYIARTMARQYRAMKEANPSLGERSILLRLYANRAAAQSTLGGPAEYRMSRKNPSLMHAAVEKNSNLFSIVRYAVFIEHPELHNPHTPSNRFEVLDRILTEILDREAPDWRKASQLQGQLHRERESLGELREHANSDSVIQRKAQVAGFREGLSIETSLIMFVDACKEPRTDTLFITDSWIEPRLQSLQELLSEPITSEQAEALSDSLAKRSKLDDVIEWLSDSTLSWRAFDQHKKESELKLRRIRVEEQKLKYEQKFAEAEMAWMTKANTPWEAAMRDKDFQAKHDPSAAVRKYGHLAHSCPKCGSPEVTWFYYVTPPPPYEQRMFHGLAGWMTACEGCCVKIDFFRERSVHY